MPRQICILEDDDDIREVITMVLESENYEVFSFSDVSSFMARKFTHEPDLYLLDIRLPDGNGLEVCELLRSDEKSGRTPIIMMSAHERIDKIKQECTANDFIAKPFDIYQLLGRVNLALS